MPLAHRADRKKGGTNRQSFASCSTDLRRYSPGDGLYPRSDIDLPGGNERYGLGRIDRTETGRVRYVTDGNALRLTSGERIRIADIDAPEIQARQAKCRLEVERGKAASRRARGLLDDKVVTFERVGLSYNRTVARVRVEGRDLGETLIATGAARPWLRHHPKPDWCS